MTLNEANKFLLEHTDAELCLIRVQGDAGFRFISKSGYTPKPLPYINESSIVMPDLITAVEEYLEFKKKDQLDE